MANLVLIFLLTAVCSCSFINHPIHLVTQWYIGNFLVTLTMCFIGDTPTKLGWQSLQGIWGGQRIKMIMNMMSYFYI